MAQPWEVQGAWTPANAQELRDYARAAGWSEDFDRFSDAQVMDMFSGGKWDPNVRMFRTEKVDQQGNPIEGFVEKPMDTPEGWEAWGQGMARRVGSGGGGGAGAGGGGGVGGGMGVGDVPTFDWTKFEAPSFESVAGEPGYKAGLTAGVDALQNSAAAKGNLFTGNTMRDMVQFGNDYATTKYNDAFNRALQGWGANFQGEQAAFQPQYGGWQQLRNEGLSRWTTGTNADLQKYLQRENNIYGLLAGSPPAFGG